MGLPKQAVFQACACVPVAKMSFPLCKQCGLATLPSTLSLAESDLSPETQQVQVEQLAIRAWLKREYLLQYNDPKH